MGGHKLSDAIVQAVSGIADGDVIGLGGFYDARQPMALIRELVRTGKKHLTVISPSGSIGLDLLIGAGVVDTLIGGRVAFGVLGLAPNFRSALERGHLKYVETDTLSIVRGFQAAYRDVPSIPTRTLLGSELLKYFPGETVVEKGETFLKVPPMRPKWCLVHFPWGTRSGALRVRNEGFDFEMMKASGRVIASVERFVSIQRLEDHAGVTAAKYVRSSVAPPIRVPYGAHPTSCFPYYVHDIEHLVDYLESVEAGRFGAYLDKYVLGPQDLFAYLDLCGGLRKIDRLSGFAERGIELALDGEGA